MRRTSGVILVVVLWGLLALTIAVSALALWVARSTDQAIALADERAGQVERFSTRATLKYLLATRPTRVTGLYLGEDAAQLVARWRAEPFTNHRARGDAGDLAFDDRPYQGLGETLFSIQDEAGLQNLNAFREATLDAMLGTLGVDLTRRPTLMRRLQDYTDFRPGFRPLGAAARDYDAAGRMAPPDRYLISPLEAYRVLGWNEQEALWQDSRWRDGTTVLEFGNLNLNTAPAWLLQAVGGFSAEIAERVVAERTHASFSGVEQAGARLGLELDPFDFRTLPSSNLRLTQWQPDSQRGFRYHVRLTPQADGREPWSIELAYPIAGPPAGVTRDPDLVRQARHPLLAAPTAP